MKKWQCLVCNYVHEGDEPPEKCPVCGADKSKFVEIKNDDVSQEKTDHTDRPDFQPESGSSLYGTIVRQMMKHHAHPVSVHVPNGVIPVSVLFIFLAAIFNITGLSQAAFYNLIVVLISMPLVIFSGYVEWKNKYGGYLTQNFIIKITCGIVVTLCAFILIIWHAANPEVLTSSKWPFLFINLIMLGAAGAAGFIGGKLVFKD